jgi:lipoprotein NlpD
MMPGTQLKKPWPRSGRERIARDAVVEDRMKILNLSWALLLPLILLSLSCVEREAGRELEQGQEEAVKYKVSPEASKVVEYQDRSGIYHTVERGQTLWRICKAYGVDMQEVAEINGLSDPTLIGVGQEIFIPGARRELKVEPAPSLVSSDGPSVMHPQKDSAPGPSQSSGSAPRKLLWPVPGGKLYSPFGMRDGRMHEGVDLSAESGTPVLAAADGKVTYSDNTIRGYGHMIVIKHSGKLSTVYAHNRRNLVKAGQFVKRGDKIAEVGQSGRATGPHLHFEVREGKRAVDPMKYLR